MSSLIHISQLIFRVWNSRVSATLNGCESNKMIGVILHLDCVSFRPRSREILLGRRRNYNYRNMKSTFHIPLRSVIGSIEMNGKPDP